MAVIANMNKELKENMNNGCNEDCEDIQTKQTIYLGIDTYIHTITVNKQAMNLMKSRDG